VHISLKTHDVWLHNGMEPKPQAFFSSLNIFCQPTDLLVLGCYNPSPEISMWLDRARQSEPIPKPYSDSFELNRRKYPMGRAYAVSCSPEVIRAVIDFSELTNGGIEKSLFFDHVLIYRPDTPVIPLLNFHDAFSGGDLYLSGLFSKELVASFGVLLGGEFTLVVNPESN
jgi:hypothetical protein